MANATGFTVLDARDVTRARVPRGRHGDRLALRRRPAPRARRRRRLRRRDAADQGLLPGRAHRPEAAALPRALQDGEGSALLVLHPVPPRPLRGPVRDRPRRALPRLGRASRWPARRSRCAQSRSEISKPGRRSTSTACTRRTARRCNVDEMSEHRYLPEGLAVGCTLRRDIAKDAGADLRRRRRARTGRLADRLRAEQLERFKGESWLSDLLAASVQPTTGAA